MGEDWRILMDLEDKRYPQDQIHNIPIKKIRPNPYQPRKDFEPEKIAELMQSIRTYGLLQPVIVRKTEAGFELVAGERRLRACRQLGWTEIPVVIKEFSENAMATVALIENLQRENLSYFEEAAGYERLLREFNLTQEVLAQRIGKSQSTIANKLRLLKLPPKIKEKLIIHELTERHARALLKLPTEEAQEIILREICNLGYTVKQTEQRVASFLQQWEKPQKERKKVIIRDIRIFLNTVRQAVTLLESGGLGPKLKEKDLGDFLEITITIPKNKKDSSKQAGEKAGNNISQAMSR